jgi:5-methylcytosine-specific restriction endonuclease McrA
MKPRRKKSAIWWPTDEHFTAIINQSINLSDVLRTFGLDNKGGNHKTVKKRIEELAIDTSHFNARIRPVREIYRLQPEQVFIDDSPYKTSVVRRMLLRYKYIPYVCNNCGNKGVWNGKVLTLQLEHKNGNNKNNSLTNLCFLCPNCHSQTDTWGNKKRLV